MDQEILKKFVADGLSLSEISTQVGKSVTSVKYWLKKNGLKTSAKRGPKFTNPTVEGLKVCRQCEANQPVSLYRKRNDTGSLSPYCKKCETSTSMQFQSNLKDECIRYLGGVCQGCDKIYPRQCYDFHHIDPIHKDFNLSHNRNKALTKLIPELDKCILLCTNCHHDIHKIMKEHSGYHNKVKGNTELWNETKLKKLEYMDKFSCSECAYTKEVSNLCIIFPDHLRHHKKTNQTHFTPEFTNALDQAKVLCRNCNRVHFNVDSET